VVGSGHPHFPGMLTPYPNIIIAQPPKRAVRKKASAARLELPMIVRPQSAPTDFSRADAADRLLQEMRAALSG
jgi:hypothetical protein